MNLWVKSLRRLAIIAVALFFFSCEDEASFLGFKNKPKFNVSYVEIPLPSSVLAIDSVVTDNPGTTINNAPFNAVGLYNDPLMGSLRAESYLQFSPSATTKLEANAEYDSVTIQLRLNFYSYGISGQEEMKFNLHEITGEALDLDTLQKRYYFNSAVQYNPETVGEATITINKLQLDTLTQDTLLLRSKLDSIYGKKLFNLALNDPNSTFSDRKLFIQEIKGLVLTPTQDNGILGFNPASSLSKITLHYHRLNDQNKIDTLERSFVFTAAPFGLNPNFTNYKADRSSSEFAPLSQPYQSFSPSSGLRAVQSGSAIVTKLDLSEFYKFAESDSVENIIINSAELVIENVQSENGLEPHSSLMMVLMNNGDEFFTLRNSVTEKTLVQYHIINQGRRFYISSDASSGEATLQYNKEEDKLSGFITSFAQSLFRYKNNRDGNINENRVTYFALFPYNPVISASVNRTVFNANNIKLRINYTQPAPVINNNN